jgi:hypothetical protein
MNEIKDLIKKAKKEEKKNPEFLYQLGLRFKNGDGVTANMFKASKYFEKACKLGHVEAHVENALFWWKTVNSYYYAKPYLNKAIELGSERAYEILFEMEDEELLKKLAKEEKKNDGLFHVTNKSGGDLFDSPRFKDDALTSFSKSHSFIRCPACRGEIELVMGDSAGKLFKNAVRIRNFGTPEASVSSVFSMPTQGGEEIFQGYICKNCDFRFAKITRKRYESRDDGLWRIVEFFYLPAEDETTGKDLLRVLKKAEGKYEEKC